MLLFYIRHGDPIYNPDSLTPLGEHQAEAVAKRLAMHGIDQIYASTSNRAYQTAVPTAELTKKEITQIDFLNEGHAWEYFTVIDADGNKRWAMHLHDFKKTFVSKEVTELGDRWYEYPAFKDYKFREGVEFFNKNTDEFMLSLGFEHDRKKRIYKTKRENNDRIAVFAHEGMGAAFLSSLLDIPYSTFSARYGMSHTGMTVIDFKDEAGEVIPRILQVSNDSHLYKEGLPIKYCNEIFI